jgi:hypothetical protein
LPYRVRSKTTFVLAVALAASVAGCANRAQLFEDNNEGGWFSKTADVFKTPDWAKPAKNAKIELGPNGPVSPNDLVNADGSCAPEPAQAAHAEAPATPAASGDRPVGSVAGDLAGKPMPEASASADPGPHLETGPGPGGPPAAGGVALGMTECQAVRRAGSPSNIAISGDKGDRKVVLTYLSGTWPGIYTFNAGRLEMIDRAPEQPKPAKAAPKKKKKAPKSASNTKSDVYVQ